LDSPPLYLLNKLFVVVSQKWNAFFYFLVREEISVT
jgi:hypothetical protein